MEKSPQYLQSLEKARGERSKEAAEVFRMEVLLDNASLARLLIKRLEDDPTTSQEQFVEFATASGKVSHPEVTSQFIKDLAVTRSLVWRAVNDLQRETKMRGVRLAKQLYRWVLPTSWTLPITKDERFYTPSREVTVDKSYPLALILYVQGNEDFQAIDSRKNVGGFYREIQFYRTQPPGHEQKLVREFPLIAVHGLDPKKYVFTMSSHTKKHEKGHAENWSFVKSLRRTRKKYVWGKFDTPYRAVAGLVHGEINPEKIRDSEDYKAVLHHAFARGKDELLAEYKAGFGNLQYHTALKVKGGPYDYFVNLGIKPENPAYTLLWDDYEKMLDEAISAVKPVVQAYVNFSYPLIRRAELFRWVLAQIPLEMWSRQIKNSAFEKEAKELQIVTASLRDVLRDERLETSTRAKIQEFLKELEENQEKPLFEILKRRPPAIGIQ